MPKDKSTGRRRASACARAHTHTHTHTQFLPFSRIESLPESGSSLPLSEAMVLCHRTFPLELYIVLIALTNNVPERHRCDRCYLAWAEDDSVPSQAVTGYLDCTNKEQIKEGYWRGDLHQCFDNKACDSNN